MSTFNWELGVAHLHLSFFFLVTIHSDFIQSYAFHLFFSLSIFFGAIEILTELKNIENMINIQS